MSKRFRRFWVAGTVGVMTVVATACGGVPTTTKSQRVSSVHLSAQGTNYLGAESRLLSGFAIGVGKGNIAAGSRVAVTGTDNGVNASGQVWYGKSLQTAKGFGLDYSSTYTNQSGVKHVHASGNLFIASTGSVPSLTSAAVAPGAGGLLLGGRRQPVQLVAAPATNGLVLIIGSETGGNVFVSGNQVTYIDQQGNVAGKYTDVVDVENNIRQVLAANVPPPDVNQVKQACQSGVTDADNTRALGLSEDKQTSRTVNGTTTESQSIISVLVTKHAQVDCKTNQATTFTLLDVSGQIDGKGFLALSLSPPVPVTAPPDDTPAPPEPTLTTFNPASIDLTLLPLAISPGGQVPTLDGAYTGTYSGSQINQNGSTDPANGALSVSVSGKTITITAPGSGSGSVDLGGGASFSFTISSSQASGGTGGTCQFLGSFTNDGGAKNAGGDMSCTGPGNSLSATWSATAK